MKPSFEILFAALLSLLSACAGRTGELPISVYEREALSFRTYEGSPFYSRGDPNAHFAPRLLPNELQFDRVTEGMEIPLNSVIAMPDYPKGGLLTLEFRRVDLQDAFVRGLFFADDESVAKDHPFAKPGIEAVLTNKKLILKLHSSVVLHLRNGMKNFPGYETFVNENAVGRATEVQGEVLYSSDHEYIKIKLGDFYVSTFPSLDINLIEPDKIKRHADGSYTFVNPVEGYKGPLPVRYPPKVISGP